MANQRVLIKKYENRRLYDATNSRYINLEEVAQLVQQGFDVQVVDAASGEDITRLILTQIIAEGAKTPDSNFPLDILRQMVIASGRASQESAVRYTKAMLDLYQSTYRAMVPALNPFDFLQNAANPAAAQQNPTTGVNPAAAGSPPAGSSTATAPNGAQAQAPSDELSQLKQRIAELERAVTSIAPGNASAPKSVASKSAAPKSVAPKPAAQAAGKARKPTARKVPARKK
jgi:polyhydroxyalkanoate synthesis repressor PhaR